MKGIHLLTELRSEATIRSAELLASDDLREKRQEWILYVGDRIERQFGEDHRFTNWNNPDNTMTIRTIDNSADALEFTHRQFARDRESFGRYQAELRGND
jgi:hypothetical protein